VVYRPEAERLGNYVPTVLDERYDAFLYCDRTEALHPLPAMEEPDLEPEIFPSGNESGRLSSARVLTGTGVRGRRRRRRPAGN
jgi:hypothetical protein